MKKKSESKENIKEDKKLINIAQQKMKVTKVKDKTIPKKGKKTSKKPKVSRHYY